MIRTATLLLLACSIAVQQACVARREPAAAPVPPVKDYGHPLPPGANGLREIPVGELPALRLTPSDRGDLIRGIDRSLAFLAKPSAARWYTADHGVTRDDVVRSLKLLKELLALPSSDEELMSELRARFRAFMSIGCDGEGTVLMTGYYTPIFAASRSRSDRYRFPLHKLPKDLKTRGPDRVAARIAADGGESDYPDANAIRAGDLLKGQELVWLEDPFDAYLIRVQGSARLRLTDGSQVEIGYAGTTGHAYSGVGAALVKDGKIPAQELSMQRMRSYFATHPDDFEPYIARNPRDVFFTETKGGPYGCLGEKVEADVTIATDKSIFPPGAALIVTHRAGSGNGPTPGQAYAGLRLDQDAGGGIRAPGRADLYMGTGAEAERRAGAQFAEGRMYYLIAK